MLRPATLALSVLFVACSTAPSASATPTPSTSKTVAVASPTSSPTVIPAPTVSPTPTASPTPIPLPSFAGIYAPSASVVWTFVAGSRLFRSLDRGDTWQERPLPSGPTPTFSFVDDHEGWALVPGSPATQCQQQVIQLSHTVDAGAAWARVSPSGIGDAQCKDALSFVDAQRGYIGTYDPNSAPLIYRTTDGGRNWATSTPLPDPPGFRTSASGTSLRIGAVRSFGATLLVAAAGPNPSAGLYAFRSSDGGATWTYASTAPTPNQDLAFVTATRWLQIGQPNDSKETTDGGVTWHAFTTTYQQAAPIAPRVMFGDPQTGYATVRGTIQRTTDGGAHWTAIRTPGTF